MNLNKYSWIFIVAIRFTLGIVFVQSGWGKIHNITNVISYFTELNIPLPNFSAHLTAWTELISGGLILIGLLTRLASFSLLIVMIVATLTTQLSQVQSKLDILGTVEFLYGLLFLGLILNGSNILSVDNVLKAKLKIKEKWASLL